MPPLAPDGPLGPERPPERPPPLRPLREEERSRADGADWLLPLPLRDQ